MTVDLFLILKKKKKFLTKLMTKSVIEGHPVHTKQLKGCTIFSFDGVVVKSNDSRILIKEVSVVDDAVVKNSILEDVVGDGNQVSAKIEGEFKWTATAGKTPHMRLANFDC